MNKLDNEVYESFVSEIPKKEKAIYTSVFDKAMKSWKEFKKGIKNIKAIEKKKPLHYKMMLSGFIGGYASAKTEGF